MKKTVYSTGAVLLLAAVFAFGFFCGRRSASAAEEGMNSTTFYAVIEEINDNSLLVEGLEVNDINSRGKFHFAVEDTTLLEWRHTAIGLSDLQEGDTIAVTYTGMVQETSPAGISDVVKIQLLDDEK